GLPSVVCGKGGGEDRGERRNGPVHEADEAWLHDTEQEVPACSLALLDLRGLGNAGNKLPCMCFMAGFDVGQVTEQLAQCSVRCPRRGPAVKVGGLLL